MFWKQLSKERTEGGAREKKQVVDFKEKGAMGIIYKAGCRRPTNLQSIYCRSANM